MKKKLFLDSFFCSVLKTRFENRARGVPEHVGFFFQIFRLSRRKLRKKMVDKETVMKELIEISPAILKFSIPVWKKIEELKKKKQNYTF